MLSVVLYHARLAGWATPILPGGFTGVDVFFVISGYLVTRSLVEKRDRNPASYLAAFFMARLRRVLPMLAAVILVTLLLGFFIMWPRDFAAMSRSAAAALAAASNIFFYLQDPYEAPTNALVPLIHTWSLSVEVQFYIAYPVLIGRTIADPDRMLRRLVALILASLAISIATHATDPSAAFFMAPGRFWEFGAGAAVFAWHQRSTLSAGHPAQAYLPWAGILLLVACVLGLNDVDYRPWMTSLLPVAGSISIVGFTDRSPAFRRMLSARPATLIGVISYSLYLWHQPVFAFARIATGHDLDGTTTALVLTAAVGLSALTYTAIEEPARRGRVFSGPNSERRRFGMAAACLLALSLAAARYPVTMSALSNTPLIYEPERGNAVVNGKPCTLNTVDLVCKLGDASMPPAYALLGDSHANTLSGPFGDMLARRGQSALLLTLTGCPFIEGVIRYKYARDCPRHVEAVLARLDKDRIKTVIVHDYRLAYLTGTVGSGERSLERNAVYPLSSEIEAPGRLDLVLEREQRTFRRLLDRGIRVIYLSTIPDAPKRVPDAVRDAVYAGTLPYTIDLESFLARSKPHLESIAALSGIAGFRAVLAHEILCDLKSARCPTHTDTRLLYTDADHLSIDGARRIVTSLEKSIFGE